MSTVQSQYEALVRQNSPEAKKLEKDATEALLLGRLEQFRFRTQHDGDLDDLEKLKNDYLVKMKTVQTERDTVMEQLRLERVEHSALKAAGINDSISNPGLQRSSWPSQTFSKNRCRGCENPHGPARHSLRIAVETAKVLMAQSGPADSF